MQTPHNQWDSSGPHAAAGSASRPSTAAHSHGLDLSTHMPNGEPIPIGEQLMQTDQAITLTLQEIDANFAKTHQIITARILPAVKRYGVASHNTWQGAKFWHRFFEAASDIHLAPSRDVATEGEATTTSEEDITALSYGTDARHDQDQSNVTDSTIDDLRRDDDGSGMLDESAFDPPRLSDASVVATARLSMNALRASGSTNRIGDEHDSRYDKADDDDADTRSKMTRASDRPSALRVQATPRQGERASNPFAVHRQAQREQVRHSSGVSNGSKNESNRAQHWDGIADLRKTPLAKTNKKARTKNAATEGVAGDDTLNDDEDSLAWPAGMSPPVTMQFSVPRSRYNKTPAKEAARMVVDDLLRTVEGMTPAARRRMVQEHEVAQHRTSAASVLQAKGRVSAGPSERGTSGLVGTPLSRGGSRKPATKGRQSIPTPPTVTKRIGGTSHSAQRESTPKSAARLMDEDEQGQSLANDSWQQFDGGDVLDNEEEEDVSADLGTGLSRLAISHASSTSPLAIEHLFAPAGVHGEQDEEDSDEELDDSESDEDEDQYAAAGAALPSQGRSYGVQSNRHGNSAGGAAGGLTTSSITSVSHSIDEDTLFGIREPSFNTVGSGGSAMGTRGASDQGILASANMPPTMTGGNRHTDVRGPNTDRRPLVAGTPSTQQAYRPKGHVAGFGTVHRGRPLGEERDDTYSAPSPTPLGAASAAFRRGNPPQS